jgi:hypothetical protein
MNEASLGLLAICPFLVAAGCTADVERRPAHCETQVTDIAIHDSTLTFVPLDRINSIVGTYECEVTWNAPGPAGVMHPQSGSTSGTASLQYDGGAVRLFKLSRVGGTDLDRLMCPSWVEVTVRMMFSTGDGGFNEDWYVPVNLYRSTPDASIAFDASNHDLRGEFTYSWIGEWDFFLSYLDAVLAGDEIWGAWYEHAGHNPVTIDGVTSGDGVVFRAADWHCRRP